MLKYCNGCKRDLEINNFYSYKKSICKQCVNKKIKCDYCYKEFSSTNLSKHIKQRHSTYNSAYNSTHKSTYNSTYDDSAFNKTDKNNIIDENDEPLYPTIGDSLYLNNFNKLKKDKIYYTKTRDKINRSLTKNRIFHDKIINKIITKREEIQYENNLNKLKDLDYLDERVCNVLLKYKYLH